LFIVLTQRHRHPDRVLSFCGGIQIPPNGVRWEAPEVGNPETAEEFSVSVNGSLGALQSFSNVFCGEESGKARHKVLRAWMGKKAEPKSEAIINFSLQACQENSSHKDLGEGKKFAHDFESLK
jgi:hypothetical protein